MKDKEPPHYQEYLRRQYAEKEESSLLEDTKAFLYSSKISLAYIAITMTLFFVTKIIALLFLQGLVGIIFVLYSIIFGQKMEDKTMLRIGASNRFREKQTIITDHEKEKDMLIGESSLAWAIKGALMCLVTVILLYPYL